MLIMDAGLGTERHAVPAPCVARPHSGLVHLDGVCTCFFGGPAPEFEPPLNPAESTRDSGGSFSRPRYALKKASFTSWS
jgi:hypothetical protein